MDWTSDRLKKITKPYLDPNDDFLELAESTKEYKRFFQDVLSLDWNTKDGRNDIFFENGKALGTYWAAMCVDDILRTKRFIQGVHAAITDFLEKKTHLEVFYAGTGPYAALMLPIILRFKPDQVSYKFVEINQASIEALRTIMSLPVFADHNIEIIQADLTKYEMQGTPDLIVSETMQNLLEKEQQVPIFFNLMKQCRDDTVFIPQSIAIHLALERGNDFNDRSYERISKLLEISKNTLHKYKGLQILADKETIINHPEINTSSKFCLTTDIQIYKNAGLYNHDSGLCMPLPFNQLKVEGETIIMRSKYIIDEHPRMDFAT
ncbi:MAG: hypothetical protein WBG46_04135 [Nonlabens sp.]